MSGRKQQSEQQKELRELDARAEAYFDDLFLTNVVGKAALRTTPNANIKSPRDAASGQVKS